MSGWPRHLLAEPALTPDEFGRAWVDGEIEADAAADAGVAVLIGGEVGIGNTTPGELPHGLAGRGARRGGGRHGAGADDATVARKQAVVADAVGRERPRLAADPLAAVADVGGLKVAALAGFFARAAERTLVVLLDGFVATAAALVADRLRPGCW